MEDHHVHYGVLPFKYTNRYKYGYYTLECMPWYRKHGKVYQPLIYTEFLEGMNQDCFKKWRHQPLVALLYYSGIRRHELARAVKEQFTITERYIIFDVGPRSKTGRVTSPLPIPLSLPYMDLLKKAIQHTKKGQRVFPYSDRTIYNVVARVFKYPHHLRLSRITELLKRGFSIPEVMAWSGHTSLAGLNAYIGLVSVDKIGEDLDKLESTH